MSVILRYPLYETPLQTIDLLLNARFLHAQPYVHATAPRDRDRDRDSGAPFSMWVHVPDPAVPTELRTFALIPTGHPFGEAVDTHRYLATLVLSPLVWHLYEVRSP